MAAGYHGFGDALVVEGCEGFGSGDEAAAAHLLFELLRLFEGPFVVFEEGMVRSPVALDQPVEDEHLAGFLAGGLRAGRRQEHRPVRSERHPVQRDLLLAHGGAVARTPERLRVGSFYEALGQRLDPLRLDRGHRAGEEPRGLHKLGRHDPCGGSLAQPRARPDHEVGAAGAFVIARSLRIVAEVGQEPDEHGAMDRPGLRGVGPASEIPARGGDGAGIGRAAECRCAVFLRLPNLPAAGQADGRRVDAEGFGELAQLRDDVGPFAKAQIVEELGAAHSAER